MIWQLSRFGVIGAIQFCVDTALYATLVKLFGVPILGNVISRGIAAVLGFWLNSRYTFPQARRTRAEQVPRYAAVWVIMTTLSAGLLAAVEWGWSLEKNSSAFVVAKVFIEGAMFILSFTLMRLWVFLHVDGAGDAR